EIFSAALDLSGDARSGFIASSCEKDPELREHVMRMLLDDEEAERVAFLAAPPSAFHDLVARSAGERAIPLFVITRPPPGPRLSPGEVLSNRYRIEAFVDRGGMGEVYRAHDLELGVPVALKTIRTEIASDPASLTRFKQEVLLARSVSHP